MSLQSLGWNNFFQDSFNSITEKPEGLAPARVIAEYKQQYKISFDTDESLSSVSGKFMYLAEEKGAFPVIGDWVAAVYDKNSDYAIIHQLLDRQSYFSRKDPGTGFNEQVIAANINTGFIVTDFNRDFNERRIERYLTFVYENGVNPVIIINKSDLCEDTASYILRIESVAPGTPVIPLSTKTLEGLNYLNSFFKPGKTACFIGSSGVGKSSIINILAGTELLRTGEIRKGGKGKHTTTHRELFDLGEKGIVIDNPGMREIQLWADEDTVDETFRDIDELSAECKFPDCSHAHEPGCAVLGAVQSGELDEKRYESYKKQKAELNRLSQYKGLSKKEIYQKRKAKGKEIAKLVKKMKRYK
ncbi:MAG: ribosome small subunit-dependent GTPase A [Spirochaetales bacterium]|nr:ribosome small subunit-dependent GTPase A [Spirochaetales bacterium]